MSVTRQYLEPISPQTLLDTPPLEVKVVLSPRRTMYSNDGSHSPSENSKPSSSASPDMLPDLPVGLPGRKASSQFCRAGSGTAGLASGQGHRRSRSLHAEQGHAPLEAFNRPFYPTVAGAIHSLGTVSDLSMTGVSTRAGDLVVRQSPFEELCLPDLEHRDMKTVRPPRRSFSSHALDGRPAGPYRSSASSGTNSTAPNVNGWSSTTTARRNYANEPLSQGHALQRLDPKILPSVGGRVLSSRARGGIVLEMVKEMPVIISEPELGLSKPGDAGGPADPVGWAAASARASATEQSIVWKLSDAVRNGLQLNDRPL
jgi:hypothetical protein